MRRSYRAKRGRRAARVRARSLIPPCVSTVSPFLRVSAFAPQARFVNFVSSCLTTAHRYLLARRSEILTAL
jgi:hypothetical protein